MKAAPACCTHVIVGPVLLQEHFQRRSLVQRRDLNAVEFLSMNPVVASVADAKGGPTQRAVVWETKRHHLRCSFHSAARKYLCEHARNCALAITDNATQTRLALERKDSAVRQRFGAAPDVRRLTLVFPMANTIPYPALVSGLKLPSHCLPAPPECKCGHSARCLRECRCDTQLEVKEQSSTALLDCNGVASIQICEARCGCGKRSECTLGDAIRQKLFVYNGVWMTFGLLVRYDLELNRQGATMTSYWQVLSEFYSKQTLSPSFRMPNKAVFIEAWWWWNCARSLDYDAAFSCEKCAALPWDQRIFILDVTRLGVKKAQFAIEQCSECWDESRPAINGW
jgi:hypothetical protein